MPHWVSAIDIGSNAIRMMVAEIIDTPPFVRIEKKFRAPVRLGHDVFTFGIIGPESMETAVQTFLRFSEINQKHGVTKYRAVATSACREAKNQREFIEKIKNLTGIDIEVIDGQEEGRLIHLAVSKVVAMENKKTMLIDIGGGSVEITFSKDSQILDTKSLPMGTVRILENLNKRNLNESHLNIIMGEFLSEICDHIYKNSDNDPIQFAIGTGGNLECLGDLKSRLLKKSPNSFLTLAELNEIIEKIQILTLSDRVQKLNLRPDRADVILPAAYVVQTVMRQAETEKILIPAVGLRDGLIWSLL